MPRLAGWREELDGLLAAKWRKPRRERLILVHIWEELRERGFEGGRATPASGPMRTRRRWPR